MPYAIAYIQTYLLIILWHHLASVVKIQVICGIRFSSSLWIKTTIISHWIFKWKSIPFDVVIFFGDKIQKSDARDFICVIKYVNHTLLPKQINSFLL